MTSEDKRKIRDEMYQQLTINLLDKWYPLAIDEECGGYFSNISHDWQLMDRQEKMIVTQARHIWTTAKATGFLDDSKFRRYAEHGLSFLSETMWDADHGGFFQIRDRDGSISDVDGWREEKRTYGNAFAIYGLAALHAASGDKEPLELAKKTFHWVEEHSYDPVHGGYFQFLTKESKVFDKSSDYKSEAEDSVELGYKDQNSSIHLLEAYTELYNVWKDEKLKQRLTDLLILIRDKLTHPAGYLRLFFENDWTPVSFRESPADIRGKNYRLDHVSFGHDYETAFLMLEASFALGIDTDPALIKAKKMMDHAIKNGWDYNKGGFFDEGYYFIEGGDCEIIKDTKNWWAQAEGLNALLLFSRIFPDEKIYSELFVKLCEYVKEYIIDKKHGGWFWGSLEKEPFYEKENKGNIWKGTYHNGRALMNCISMLSDENNQQLETEALKSQIEESEEFITHWRKTADEIF